LLIGKVSDQLIECPAEKTHHKFASGVIELFLEFFHLLFRTQNIPYFLGFKVGVSHNKFLLAKYEAHQRVMNPFTNFVDQVPD
jgi:hypothetical protein